MDPSQESAYGRLFTILASQPGFVLSTVLLALLIGLWLAIMGAWLPWFALRWTEDESGPEKDQGLTNVSTRKAAVSAPVSLVSLLTLSIGGGLCSVVFWGTLSAFVFKQLIPGAIIASVLGLLAASRLVIAILRRRISLKEGGWAFAIVTGASFLIGFWQHVFTEIPDNSRGIETYVYSELQGDTAFHVFLASVLKETGLPLRNLYGSTEHDYSPVTHTGHGVLIGTFSSLLGISVYRASTSLWIVATVLIVWATFDLLSRATLPKGFLTIGSLSPLLLGPVSIPVFALLANPQLARNQEPLISARMYWNVTQAISTSLGAVVLLCFHLYGRTESESHRLRMIGITTLVLIASGWVKPSLIIFYGPALLLSLLVHRAPIRDLAVVIGLLVMGVAVYLLPAWLVPVPEVPSWSLHPSWEQTMEVLSFVVFGCGAGLLLSIGPLKTLIATVTTRSEPQAITLALIAMGGSLIFALLFREEQFVGFRVFQPNLWWGPSACVVLLFPLVLLSSARRIKQTGRADGLILAGLLLGAIQLLNGSLFAAAYPAVISRAYVSAYVDTLRVAGSKTPPQTRFLLDPAGAQLPVLSALGRPTLIGTSFMADVDLENLKEWKRLFVEPFETDSTGWSQYDAALLHKSSTHAQENLQELGWTVEQLNDDFQLWRR
ncbi:MAG: hypothetical protein R3C02_12045 [Planctomycetaceae bacterium]